MLLQTKFSGQGLGKEEHGIKEAIKVKIKKDTAGVGYFVFRAFLKSNGLLF